LLACRQFFNSSAYGPDAPAICKEFATERIFSLRAKYVCVFAMKAKRTLPASTTGRRPRRSFETSQKKERDAIDAALKRLMGDDGFRPRGVFSKRKPA
jgi:hypothetical protein